MVRPVPVTYCRPEPPCVVTDIPKRANHCNVLSQRNDLNKLTHYDDTKKRAHHSHIVQAKENLKLSHSGASQKQVSGTNQPIKAFRQSNHWVWGLTQSLAIQIETKAMNHGWVNNLTTRHTDCRNNIHVLSNPTFYVTFDYLFELITKIRLSHKIFSIYKLNHHKIFASMKSVLLTIL